MKKEIKIAGAGISGLSAAIFLALRGHKVKIYESSSHPGGRFGGDWQHLENWSDLKEDVIDFLKRIGIKINFFVKPIRNFEIYFPNEKNIKLESEKPFFYSVRRGEAKDSIDNGMAEQAINLGVEIVYNHPVKNENINILATGPIRGGKGFLAGINFVSESEEKIIVLFNKKISKYYSYLEILNGRGTLATHHQSIIQAKNNLKILEQKIKKELNIDIQDKSLFLATGNFSSRNVFIKNKVLYVGEAAGLQDNLAGFGMLLAVKSSLLAAKSIAENKDYESICFQEIIPIMKASLVNGVIRKIFPNFLINFSVKIFTSINKKKSSINYRAILNRIYNYNLGHKILFPFAKILNFLIWRR